MNDSVDARGEGKLTLGMHSQGAQDQLLVSVRCPTALSQAMVRMRMWSFLCLLLITVKLLWQSLRSSERVYSVLENAKVFAQTPFVKRNIVCTEPTHIPYAPESHPDVSTV